MQICVLIVSCDGKTRVFFFCLTADLYVSCVWCRVNRTSFQASIVDFSNTQKNINAFFLIKMIFFCMGFSAWRHYWRYHASHHFTQCFSRPHIFSLLSSTVTAIIYSDTHSDVLCNAVTVVWYINISAVVIEMRVLQVCEVAILVIRTLPPLLVEQYCGKKNGCLRLSLYFAMKNTSV